MATRLTIPKCLTCGRNKNMSSSASASASASTSLNKKLQMEYDENSIAVLFKRYFEKYTKGKEIGDEKKCIVFKLNCKKDLNFLKLLQILATQQDDNFDLIYPWESACQDKRKSKDINYIALEYSDKTKLPNICGWANIYYDSTSRKFGKQKFVLINQISTARIDTDQRRKAKSKYKGVGRDLIYEIVEDVKNMPGIDYILLTSAHTAIDFYSKLRDTEGKLMFQSLFNSEFTKILKEKELTVEFYKVINTEPNKKLVNFMQENYSNLYELYKST
jgi:hypothetical protein